MNEEKRQKVATARQARLKAAIEGGQAIERQYKGKEGWHPVSQAEAAQALNDGDDGWFRVAPGGPVVVRPSDAKSVVVYGPQGCGKTRHAEELRQHFGLDRVCELEHTHHVRALVGTLYLTHATHEELLACGAVEQWDRRVLSFDAALAAARGQA